MDSKTLDSLVGEWKFDLAFSGHGGMGADPNMLNRYHLDMKSSQQCSLRRQSRAKRDPGEPGGGDGSDKRKELVDSAQEIIAQDLPALPLLTSPTLLGFQ